MLGGERRELDAIRHAEFLVHACEMVLHGIFRDRRRLRDFLVGVAGDDQAQYLALAPREAMRDSVRRWRRVHQGSRGFDEVGDEAGIEPAASLEHPANRLQQDVSRGTLQHQAAHAQADRLGELGARDRPGQQDHSRSAGVARQLRQRGNAGHDRHADIQEHQVGVDGLKHAHGLVAIGRFGDHLEARRHCNAVNVGDHRGWGFQQLPEARPKQAIVVRKDDAGRADWGRRQWTVHERGVVSTESIVDRSSWSVNGLLITALNP